MIKAPKPFERKVIASPEDYSSLSKECKVIGAFNPGVAQIKTEKGLETILMIRVAESPSHKHPNWLPFFHISNKNYSSNLELDFDKPLQADIEEEHKKHVKLKDETNRLKHISLPRLMKLDEQGNIIERNQEPCIHPLWEYERFGIEDIRITDMTKTGLEEIINNSKNYIKGKLGYGQSLQGNYVLTYVIPHREEGVSTPFIITKDFEDFKRLPEGNTPRPSIVGIKDVIPFPEKVRFPHKTESIRKNQKVYAGFIRPNAFSDISSPGIWIVYSSDGIIWGNPHRLTKGKTTGSGTPPIKIGGRWLSAYHEITEIRDGTRYDVKLMSMDGKEPWKDCKTSELLLKREDYRDILPEDGYTPNVVYPTGMIINDGITTLFVGVDDTWTVMDKSYTEDNVKFLKES
jgi:predicted GH43/DUF377 family glycosyl hydrolase